MQHELRIASEQARRVDAQGEIGADAVAGVAIHHRLRVTIDPAALHGVLRPRKARGRYCAKLALAPPAGAARLVGRFAVRAAADHRLRQFHRLRRRRSGFGVAAGGDRRALAHGGTPPRRALGGRMQPQAPRRPGQGPALVVAEEAVQTLPAPARALHARGAAWEGSCASCRWYAGSLAPSCGTCSSPCSPSDCGAESVRSSSPLRPRRLRRPPRRPRRRRRPSPSLRSPGPPSWSAPASPTLSPSAATASSSAWAASCSGA